MSSPAQGGPSAPKEEKDKKGLNKMLSRVKTVLRGKGEGSSKRKSLILSGSTQPAKEPAKKTYVHDVPIH